MGTETSSYYTKLARRELWKRRLQILGNVGLALLAAVTIAAVAFALRR